MTTYVIAPESTGLLAIGDEIASGTFSRVCALDDSRVIKIFSSRRQFARTTEANDAIRGCDGDIHVEEIASRGAYVGDRNTIVYYTIMPRYVMNMKNFVISYANEKNTGLPAVIVISLARQLFSALRALESAHIIHCDIKPSNILLRDAPRFSINTIESFDVVLCDFGSSRVTDESGACECAAVGTIPYVAPEILLGNSFNHAADIWSAMLTVFTIITGDQLIDVFNDDDLDYGGGIANVFIDADDDSQDTSMTDASTTDCGSREECAIDFPSMYAHIVLMYRTIGQPPERFCTIIAPEYYISNKPRYHRNIAAGNISKFMMDNYYALSQKHTVQIQDFMSLGLQYIDSDRCTADDILHHKFLAKKA